MLARFRHTSFALLGAAVLASSACVADKDALTGPGPDPNAPTYANVQASLQQACASCHAAGSGRGYLVSMDSATLVASGFVNPTTPNLSLIITKARGVSHGGGNVTSFSATDSARFVAWAGGLGGGPGADATDVSVAVAYDAGTVAFRFTWKSQEKTLPAGRANVGQRYPMSFHDLLRASSGTFARFASSERLQEDRVSFMIQQASGPAGGFGNSGCYIACHSTTGVGDEDHRLLTTATLDHWHWRGGRSGPMGYAEDAAVNQVTRIRDASSAAASRWIRAGGDRFRESQGPLAGTGIDAANGKPRFVFNRGKAMPGGYTIPRYFIATTTGATMTDPFTQIPAIRDLSVNRSLVVAYQDLTFDAVDKMNGLDVGYLVFVANGVVAHLPAHLRDTTTADHIAWRNYWATHSGVAVDAAAAALTKITEIDAEWTAAEQNAMIARSVGFIYDSDQHDVTSVASYDDATSEWRVTLYRQLYSSSVNDADLSGLPSGLTYEMGFAMHDVGGGAVTHDISMPYTVGTAATVDIRAVPVGNVRTVDWSAVTPLHTNWIRSDYKVTLDWLLSPAHQGSVGVNAMRCQSCHIAGGSGRVLNP